VNTVSGLKVLIPENLLNIHAYSPEYLKLVELQTRINLKYLGKTESYKGKLFIGQDGKCVICNKALLVDSFLKDGNLHIDYIKPISEGGDKSKISNMRLIHI
jgi:5-methylcytosine-specific restriction endonuclease McrA